MDSSLKYLHISFSISSMGISFFIIPASISLSMLIFSLINCSGDGCVFMIFH